MKIVASLLALAALSAASFAAPAAKSQTHQDGARSGAPGGTWTPSATPPSLPALPAGSASASASVTIQPTDPSASAAPTAPPGPAVVPATPPATTTAPDADHGQWTPASKDRLVDQKFLHGFRLGYAYVANFEKPVESLDGVSLKEKINMKTPHSFLLGYEGVVRLVGHSWLNVILVGNAMVAGLEQSKFFPTGNGLLGFEIDNSFQLGVGASVTPLRGQEAHSIIAAGWTPRAGGFYVPVHAFFIPDVDGLHRTGVTTGVTW